MTTFFSTIHTAFRIALATASLAILASVVVLTTTRQFDVVSILLPSLSTTKHQEDSSTPPVPTWIPFLGGEFTLSVLFPLSLYGLLSTTIRPPTTSLLPSGMCLCTLLGLVAAHGVLLRYTGSDTSKSHEHAAVVRNMKCIAALFGLAVIYLMSSSGSISMFGSDEPYSKQSSRSTHVPWMVRGLVKLGALLQIVTGIAVIGMGISTHSPNYLMPNLIWEASNGDYRYDIFQTFGEETVTSFPFFYLLLSTMMATIFPALFVGVWVFLSPISSKATSEGLTVGVVGVPLIILANLMTMSIYDKHFDGFEAGKDCMIGHIALLVQANFYSPIVWLIYHFSRWLGGRSEKSSDDKID